MEKAHHGKTGGAEAVSAEHEDGNEILMIWEEGGDKGEEADGEEAEHPEDGVKRG